MISITLSHSSCIAIRYGSLRRMWHQHFKVFFSYVVLNTWKWQCSWQNSYEKACEPYILALIISSATWLPTLAITTHILGNMTHSHTYMISYYSLIYACCFAYLVPLAHLGTSFKFFANVIIRSVTFLTITFILEH